MALRNDVNKMYTIVGQYPMAADPVALIEKAQKLMLAIKEQVMQKGTALNKDDKHHFDVAVGHYKQLWSIAKIEVDKNIIELEKPKPIWQRAQLNKQGTPSTHNIENLRPKR